MQNYPSKFQPSKNYFHLSFDDGLRGIFDIAAPILLKKGIPATVFLNADFVDNNDLFFRYKAALILDHLKKKPTSKAVELKIKKIAPEGLLSISFINRNKLDQIALLLGLNFSSFLTEKKPYLTTAQIKTLQNQGFTFGGHSLNHPYFRELNLEEQITQATESVHFVNQLVEKESNAFAFPFTDYGISNAFFENEKVKNKIHISFGTAGLNFKSNTQHWQRMPMEGTNWSGKNLVKTEYLYFLIKKVLKKQH